MDTLTGVGLFLSGVIAGGFLCFLWRQSRLRVLQQELACLEKNAAVLEERLSGEQRTFDAQMALLQKTRDQLADTFKALSAEALTTSQNTFLNLAKTELAKQREGAVNDLEERRKAIDHLVQPLRETLDKVGVQMHSLEKTHAATYAGFNEQVKGLMRTHSELQSETANLVKALRQPAVRGRWGEIQLKRVVEMAGMLEYCDFRQQESTTTEAGRLRPDLVIQLPNQRQIVVDAKTPLQGYLDALEATNEQDRKAALDRHAKAVRQHLVQLGSKNYWNCLENTPEFVILFLPGETFFSAALEQDPSLIEFGVDQKVLLATPTTLIALLKSVAYGWNQEKLTRNALRIHELGKTFYERLQKLCEYFMDLRKGLEKSTEAYNALVRSLESRVLVTARQFQELGSGNTRDLNSPGEMEGRPLAASPASGTENGVSEERSNGLRENLTTESANRHP